MSKENYQDTYYEDRHDRTAYSARVILSHVLDLAPDISSAVDVGCGVGTWLAVLQDRGIIDTIGIDGPWVKKDLLEIPRDHFIEANLANGVVLDRQFDLAISLEVAEHLPEEAASIFVKSLVSLSDIVLFSAAIPYQGARSHINEQWPDYWARLFERHGFVALDILRERIWNDENIPFWYRQNVLLFARYPQKLVPELEVSRASYPRRLVHPDKYLQINRNLKKPQGAFRYLLSALKQSFLRALR